MWSLNMTSIKCLKVCVCSEADGALVAHLVQSLGKVKG